MELKYPDWRLPYKALFWNLTRRNSCFFVCESCLQVQVKMTSGRQSRTQQKPCSRLKGRYSDFRDLNSSTRRKPKQSQSLTNESLRTVILRNDRTDAGGSCNRFRHNTNMHREKNKRH